MRRVVLTAVSLCLTAAGVIGRAGAGPIVMIRGATQFSAAIREHIRLARLLASWVEGDPDFELAAPVPLSVVNFRYAPPGVGAEQLDALNEALVEAVAASGEAFVTTARIAGT